MRTFYVLPHDIKGNRAILRDREFYHAYRILRKRRGDRLRLVDGIGGEYIGVVEKIDETKKEMELLIEEKRRNRGESSVHIALAQGLIKGERMEYALEKATELGVREIYPLIPKRSVRIREECPRRWKLKIIEAMKQSGRTLLPALKDPITFDELLEIKENYELAILFDPSGENPLEISIPSRVLIAIGPEGGFSPEEVEKAFKSGFQVLSLGDRILRAETASCVAIALLHFKRGEF